MFGIIRGSLIVCILFILLEIALGPNYKPKWLTSAKSIALVAKVAEIIRLAIPEDLVDNPAFEFGEKARKSTQDILDTARTVNSIISPQPKDKNKNIEGTYSRKELQDMERLIDSNQSEKQKIDNQNN